MRIQKYWIFCKHMWVTSIHIICYTISNLIERRYHLCKTHCNRTKLQHVQSSAIRSISYCDGRVLCQSSCYAGHGEWLVGSVRGILWKLQRALRPFLQLDIWVNTCIILFRYSIKKPSHKRWFKGKKNTVSKLLKSRILRRYFFPLVWPKSMSQIITVYGTVERGLGDSRQIRYLPHTILMCLI